MKSMTQRKRISKLSLWVTAAVIAAGAGLGVPAITAMASTGTAAAQPASFNPSTCGPWSGEGTATTAAINLAHGPIRNCVRVGSTWVIVTSGGPRAVGAIGVLSCGNSVSCLDGWHNPGVGRMRWLHPKGLVGGATLLQVSGSKLILDYDGRQVVFNVATHQFAASGSEKI